MSPASVAQRTVVPGPTAGVDLLVGLTPGDDAGVSVVVLRLPDVADLVGEHGANSELARMEIISQLTERARRLMGPGDVLVRSGPDAYTVVALHADGRTASRFVDDLRAAVSPPMLIGPFAVHESVAAAPEDDDRAGDAPGDASVGSPLPMLAVSLPDQRVTTANAAACALFGLDVDELVGRIASDLFQVADSEHGSPDLSALAAGSVESYRARRTVAGARGPVDAWIWVRSIPRREGAMALVLVLPADNDDLFRLSVRTLMGPLSVDLATGTMDLLGNIVTISRSNPGMLHLQRDSELGARSFASHVHPQDVPLLMATLEDFRHGQHDVALVLRLRHAHRGWINIDCHLFATGDDDRHEPIGYVLAETAAGGASPGRIAQLEQHLTRIAAEARAAGLFAELPSTSSHGGVDLDRLTPRQREIVERLLDGQRVPTIAAALFVSRSTVRNHLAGVYRAFEVHSQADLIELLRIA